MLASCCEKRPAGFFAVPLNIRCSRKCAMPDLPAISSAAPTRYHSMWVTTGVRWSGTTTTARPLASLNCETEDAASAASRPKDAARAKQSANRAKRRISAAKGDALKSPMPCTGKRHDAPKNANSRAPLLAPDRTIQNVRNLPAAAFVDAGAIGIVRRRGLVTGWRLGERATRRLAGELGLLVQVRAHEGIPIEDAR